LVFEFGQFPKTFWFFDMKERDLLMVKLVATHIVPAPLLAVLPLLISRDGFLSVAVAQSVVVILYLSGYWEFFGLKFRWIFCLSVEALLLLSLSLRLFVYDSLPPDPGWIISLGLIQLWMLILLIRILLVVFRIDPNSIRIAFPFKEGRYLVTDGGNSRGSRMMNYHFYSPVHKKKGTNRSMRFAADMVMLESGRHRFLPLDNHQYPVFGERLYSPIGGTVFKVMEGIPDNAAFAGNYPYNTGNTVVVRQNDLFLLLGHMKQGSIAVREGDRVKAGDYLGMAGNSGMSERPHLHMQAMRSETDHYWNGEGVGLLFEGRNLFKNRIIRIPAGG
jgi:hypothetical protein